MKPLPPLTALLAIVPLPLSFAEFRRFDGPINAASNYIHFSEGFVVTPGYVDISDLIFASADNGRPNEYVPEERNWSDGGGGGDDDDAGMPMEEVDDFSGDDATGGENRFLDGSYSDNQRPTVRAVGVSFFVLSARLLVIDSQF